MRKPCQSDTKLRAYGAKARVQRMNPLVCERAQI